MTTDPFLSYIENIQKKTGKTPQQINEMLRSEGVLKDSIKALQIASKKAS
jgi:SOS response regulatory protein OraA/RecX